MNHLFLSLSLISAVAFGDDASLPNPRIQSATDKRLESARLDEQVAIPAGKYAVGENREPIELSAFEIDRFEVSIGRYAKFIEWCRSSPDEEHKFDHPTAPRHLSHATADVVRLIKNAQVRDGRVFKDSARGELGAPIDLNCPIIGITWWDAYAFAKWEGKTLRGGEERDLPTDVEWEAAARGPAGLKVPWGDVFDARKTNSGADYSVLEPGAKAEIDGYNYWAPVDKLATDRSPLKVEGMGGNVAEWVYRKLNTKEIVALKGGSFATGPTEMSSDTKKLPSEDCWFVYPANVKATMQGRKELSDQYFVDDPLKPEVRALYIGFRTVKRG